MKRIRLILWNADTAQERVGLLSEAGYRIEYDPITNALLKAIKAKPPAAVVIDLSRAPSRGRDMGVYFRKYKNTRQVPIIFVEGTPDKVAMVKQTLPDAVYTCWPDIIEVLPDAITNPPENPSVPDSLMAGYSGTPLPKKLGIRQGSTVALLNAPDGFEGVLDVLPDGVTVIGELADGVDVTLWFIRCKDGLDSDIERIGAVAGDGKLWIVWPKKSSGVESDLTQAVVRQIGLDSGLVDFKIAAIDETWSGLCFTKRKK
jgi:hypothetical protein